MIKKYFTALIPASNLEYKYRNLQRDYKLQNTLPPIAPLNFYKKLINSKDFKLNINPIEEFKTGDIVKSGKWWVVTLPSEPLLSVFETPADKDFTCGLFGILLAPENNEWNPPKISQDIIRNWELGFYELIIWDEENPFNNIELTLHWKIKKRRNK